MYGVYSILTVDFPSNFISYLIARQDLLQDRPTSCIGSDSIFIFTQGICVWKDLLICNFRQRRRQVHLLQNRNPRRVGDTRDELFSHSTQDC